MLAIGSLGSEAFDTQARIPPKTSESMEGAHTTQSSKTAGLPSPPSSVKAGTSEIESNDNDSQGANVDQISGEGSSTRAKVEADPGEYQRSVFVSLRAD